MSSLISYLPYQSLNHVDRGTDITRDGNELHNVTRTPFGLIYSIDLEIRVFLIRTIFVVTRYYQSKPFVIRIKFVSIAIVLSNRISVS